MTRETFGDGTTVTYDYDNTGALATVTDSATGIKTTYYYDLIDRMVKYVESGSDFTHSVQYTYDQLNNLSRLVETIGDDSYTTEYTYDADNRVTQVANGDVVVDYAYDGYGRLQSNNIASNGASVISTSYVYNTSQGKATSQVSSIERVLPNTTLSIGYQYDANGNITGTTLYTSYVTYTYDTANQLTRENNESIGKTWVWTYDDAGNILSRTEYAYTTGELGDPVDTVLYTYGDASWGDLLTGYDGNTITYDGIGNPLSDGTWTYTWQNGRELASMSNGVTTWTYTYDANGMRKTRSDGTNTYTYLYNGSQLVQMTKGEDTLHFYYDAAGTPVAIKHNTTLYYCVTTVQGDVLALVDTNGHTAVYYDYDAWGNIHGIFGTKASTLGVLNPLTYRAYTYDHETGLYYLQSRYYNPEVGRFLNADNYPSTGQGLTGNNMFAYCGNNPVSRKDDGGEFWNVIVGAAIGAVVNTVVSYAASKMAGEEFSLADAAVAFAGGAITGAVAATGLGAFGQALVGAAVGFGGSVMNNVLEGETISWGTAAINGIAGFAGGLIGGNGIRKARGKLDIAQKALDYATSLKDSGAKMVRNTVTKAFQTAAATYAEVYATESLITLGRFYAGAWGAAIISKGSTQLLALEMG